MEENTKENYSTTYLWMYELGLRPAAIRVYAVIYSFTKHGQTWRGSCATLAEYARSTRSYVNCILKELSERGLIRRVREERKGVSLPEYVAVRPGETDAERASDCSMIKQGLFENQTEVVQKSNRGCSRIEHNNKEDNKDKNKEINIIPSAGGLTKSESEANTVNINEKTFGEVNGSASEGETRRDGSEDGRSTDRRDETVKGRSAKNRADNAAFEGEFEALWELYPRKQGRAEALAAYIRARRTGTSEEAVRGGIEAYNGDIAARGTEPRFIRQGGNWFAGRCWEDEHSAPPENGAPAGSGQAIGASGNGTQVKNTWTYASSGAASAPYGVSRALNYSQHIYTEEELKAMGITFGEEIYSE